MGRVRQNAERTAAKHLRKVELGLYVDGQGKGVDAAVVRLPDSLADVSDAVTSFIAVVIDRLAIAEQQQERSGELLVAAARAVTAGGPNTGLCPSVRGW